MKNETKTKSKFRQYWGIFVQHAFINGGIVMAIFGLGAMASEDWQIIALASALILIIAVYNTLSEYFEEKKCNKEPKWLG